MVTMATKELTYADCGVAKEFFCRKMRLFDMPETIEVTKLMQGEW